MLLSEAIDYFVASVCAGKVNQTARSYRDRCKYLLRFLGDVPLDSIDRSDIERFRISILTQRVKMIGRREVVEPLSVWHVRGIFRMVRYLFRWAADRGLVLSNAAVCLSLPKKPQIRPKAIESATFDKLLQAAAAFGFASLRPRNLALLYLLRDTGARISGLLTAPVSALDLKACRLEVVEKGDRARWVFFHDVTRRALERWLVVRSTLDPKCDNLFINAHGRRWGAQGVKTMLSFLFLHSGLPPGTRYNPHSFRHAFARDSLRAGADLASVSQMMGHSDVSVTAASYARFVPDELQALHLKTSPGSSMPDVLVR